MDYFKYLGSNKSDEKYTPRYAVLPIIKYLSRRATIWCPFDTEHSEFVLTLKEHRFKVVHSHICTGQDFFKYEPERWDVIVSNPPFSNKAAVFGRCLGFGKPVSYTHLDVYKRQRVVDPVRSYNEVLVTNGKSNVRTVYVVPQFTIPDDKILIIELFEKNGGRHQTIRVENADLVAAKVINELKIK